MPDELTILSHPARVHFVLAARSPELLAMIKDRHALDEAVMALHPPFLWRAEISNDLLDSHFTHMAESSLRNYATDAKTGVAFLKGHDWRSLPIGYSLDASFHDDGGKKRVEADFYTVSGLPETDDLILRMRSGILRDVSIGFHGGEMICDLCQRDFWSCPHMPGLRYEIKEGDLVRTVLATFTINNARLSEVSGVFDGSTPGAVILKAQQEAGAGRLTAEQTRILEQQYRVKLPAAGAQSGARAFAGVDVPGQKPGKVERMSPEQFAQLTNILIRAGVLTDAQRDSATEADVLGAADKLTLRVKELEPQAADGRQYRADLVAEALAEGVRAQGKDFDKPTYEGVLTNAAITTIKRMRDDWKKVGDERLPAGRTSVDNADDGQETKSVSLVPDSAYGG